MICWFWADCRQQLPGLSLALMALLLALSTNIGVGAMVEVLPPNVHALAGCDRLIAEVYVEASDDAAGVRIKAWLARRPEVEAILPVFRTKTQIARWPVEISALPSHGPIRGIFRCSITLRMHGRAWPRATLYWRANNWRGG